MSRADLANTVETLKRESKLLDDVTVQYVNEAYVLRGIRNNIVVIDLRKTHLKPATEAFRQSYALCVSNGVVKAR